MKLREMYGQLIGLLTHFQQTARHEPLLCGHCRAPVLPPTPRAARDMVERLLTALRTWFPGEDIEYTSRLAACEIDPNAHATPASLVFKDKIKEPPRGES